ncbi:hypothetical protein LOAG_10038, partial [Loa loa]|uniref:Uncharacterized protein n=1 Tax=Loa loa TaxID=7209 RepID=A0A1I7W4G7_LOALO
MGDKYEMIDQNNINLLTSPMESPFADPTPLPDPEAEPLKSSTTDLYTKKFEPE